MVRAVILYEREPEPERYAQHVRLCRAVDCGAFRHGKAFGAPSGQPAFAYYAEFEWDDLEAFKASARTEAFAATGKDAAALGIPFTVTFVEVE